MPRLLTNVHDLPQAVVDAVLADPYTGGGDISCTKLIDAPQPVDLGRWHADEIVVDVSDRVWSLLGQAVHTILERAGLRQANTQAEVRLYAEVLGWQVSGQLDLHHLDTGIISDYKVTTVWKQHGNDSWTRQLNVLRWLAVQNGHDIRGLEVIGIFRDWRKAEAQQDEAYPRAAIQRIPIPLWSLEDAEEYVIERVRMHQAARRGVPMPCTDEDRWKSPDKWAAMKPGGKRALKVVTSDAMPSEAPPAGAEWVRRPGEYKRCLTYCDVAPFCAQWQDTLDGVVPEEEG
jgi:hypothetical protein